MKTRFAPSPTGWLHFGNLRTALFNYLYAKSQGGEFILRIEDTDKARNEQRYVDGLLTDLDWLSLSYKEPIYYQSKRADFYNKLYAKLEAEGLAYPCFCSEELLKVTRKAQLNAGQAPRYTGTCSNLTPNEIERHLARGVKPTLRFKVPANKIISFVDLIKGPQKFAAKDIGDFIIRRNDGSASFMFCNAVDDSDMGITHSLRGDDHITNTPRQLLILEALGMRAPSYGHFPMINGDDGAPLSKRNGSASVYELREAGFLPKALMNYLARLGHNYGTNELMSLETAARDFSLSNISSSSARHDPTHMKFWQKSCWQAMSIDEISQSLAEIINGRIDSAKLSEFISIVRENILMPEDVALWVDALGAANLSYSPEAVLGFSEVGECYFDSALQYLAQADATMPGLIKHLKANTSFSGKALFMPLRLALTGQEHGPELAAIYAYLGQELTRARLEQAKASCQ